MFWCNCIFIQRYEYNSHIFLSCRNASSFNVVTLSLERVGRLYMTTVDQNDFQWSMFWAAHIDTLFLFNIPELSHFAHRAETVLQCLDSAIHHKIKDMGFFISIWYDLKCIFGVLSIFSLSTAWTFISSHPSVAALTASIKPVALYRNWSFCRLQLQKS